MREEIQILEEILPEVDDDDDDRPFARILPLFSRRDHSEFVPLARN